MLSAPTIDLTFDSDDDWIPDPPKAARLYRAASVGNSWGVTSMGRGFDWDKRTNEIDPSSNEQLSLPPPPKLERSKSDRDADVHAATKRRNRRSQNSLKLTCPTTTVTPANLRPTPSIVTQPILAEPDPVTLEPSNPASPRPITPGSVQRHSPTGSYPPTSPRPRRRSSQQRVSLVAGRVLIAPMEPPASSVMVPPTLHRGSSAKSLMNHATSSQPLPLHNKQSFLGDRNISEFVIEKEIGRGAYGLVKLAREIQEGGSLGVRFMAAF
jgi:protein-serine/threonine kinase